MEAAIDKFRAYVLEMLLNGEISREAALSVLHAHSLHPEQGWTETKDGYHTIRDIVNLLGSGKKIEAIKKFRETFRVSLLGSKDAVECIHDIAFRGPNGL